MNDFFYADLYPGMSALETTELSLMDADDQKTLHEDEKTVDQTQGIISGGDNKMIWIALLMLAIIGFVMGAVR